MAHNLQLEAVSEDDVFIDEDHKKTIIVEPERSDPEIAENSNIVDENDSNNKDSLDDQASKQSEDSKDKVENKEHVLQQSLPNPVPQLISPQLTRRASVITHKLQHHETLAARLDRIESDKENVKKELMKLKEVVQSISKDQQFGPVSLSDTSQNVILEVHQRLAALENFLDGFGVTAEDFEEKSETQVDDENAEETEEIAAASFSRKRSRIEVNVNTDNDESDSEKSEGESADTESQIEEQSIGVTIVPDIVEDTTRVNYDEEKKDIQISVAIEKNAMKQDLNNKDEKEPFKKKESFRKSQGLLLHLVEQEKRFKEDIDSMLHRLFTLEEKIEHKVPNESLEKFILDTKSQLDQIRYSTVGNVQSTFDDSKLNANITKIQGSLDEVKKELDLRISKLDLQRELERHQSNNILSSLQDGNNDIDGEMLKQLHNMIQNELESLRDQKLDKVLFTKTVEDTKSEIIGNLTKSVSNQETKLMNAITKAEIDINDCKDSISMIENLLETKFVETDDSNLLDEKIKNATEAMELNLQEIISSRMNCLKAMEDEVEKVASGLAEKPDQEQINDMLQNLEETVLKRFGKDDTFQSVLESMKSGK